jgi:hypothetical protein
MLKSLTYSVQHPVSNASKKSTYSPVIDALESRICVNTRA